MCHQLTNLTVQIAKVSKVSLPYLCTDSACGSVPTVEVQVWTFLQQSELLQAHYGSFAVIIVYFNQVTK